MSISWAKGFILSPSLLIISQHLASFIETLSRTSVFISFSLMSANIKTRERTLEYIINKIYRFYFYVAVAALRRSKDQKRIKCFIHFDCYWTAPPVRAQIPPSSDRTVKHVRDG